jgi:predicted phage terminase large subunit-like protein
LPPSLRLRHLWPIADQRDWVSQHALTMTPAPALGFDAWLTTTAPRWPWHYAHLAYVRAQLQRVTDGTCKRLMLFMPPRHYKSEMTTVRYSAYRLERDPGMRVIIGAYNQILADKFSRKTRRIVESRLPLSRERTAVQDWETPQGGGLRAVGVGGGITGQGGDLIIIDDPVKSREEAESQAYRDRVYEWYTDDLYTRAEAGAAIILIMTLWHEDDLAGRILASEDGPNWTVVRLPAEAEADDPLGRALGAPLCPDKFDADALADRRRVLGDYSYNALYQQQPRPRDGAMFQRSWFTIVGAAPAEADRVRYWDNAGTKDGGAYTCGVLMARDRTTGLFYVEDMVRGQWEAPERETMKRQTAELDKARYGKVTIWNEQEPGSGGKESAQSTIRNLAGFVVYAEPVTGDKVTRAEPFAVQAAAKNVKIVRDTPERLWNAGYLDRLCAFPTGKYKDDVDASSGALNKLTGRKVVRAA